MMVFFKGGSLPSHFDWVITIPGSVRTEGLSMASTQDLMLLNSKAGDRNWQRAAAEFKEGKDSRRAADGSESGI
jgi:hypothetical protein